MRHIVLITLSLIVLHTSRTEAFMFGGSTVDSRVTVTEDTIEIIETTTIPSNASYAINRSD